MLNLKNDNACYDMKAYEIPEASRTSRGTAIVNLLQLMPGEVKEKMGHPKKRKK